MSLLKTKAIAISSVKYGDSGLILKCFTEEAGLQSYFISGYKSNKSIVKVAQTQPLMLLEIESYQTPGKLGRIKEIKCTPALRSIHFNMIKISVVQFVAEIISRCIREENHKDPELFRFLSGSIQLLDIDDRITADFPCYFVAHLSKQLGLSLITSSEKTNSIDQISAGLQIAIDNLLNHDFSTIANYSIPREIRPQLLEYILKHFALHIPEFGQLKSYPILKEILN